MTRHPRGPRVVSIRWIVAGAAVLLTAGVGLALTGVAERNARRILLEAAEGSLLLQARNLALTSADALLTDYPELTLAPLVNRMLADQKDLRIVVVVDRAGLIQGHSEVRQIGLQFSNPPGLEPAPTTLALDSLETLMRNEALLFASSPIRHRNGDMLGVALVGLRLETIDRAVTRGRREQQAVFAVLLLIGVAATVVLLTLLLRPIATLRAGIERIGGGDLTGTLTLRDRTEFGLLADAINQMVARLRSAQSAMLERERLAHEMELAQQIQRSLLPAAPLSAGRFVVEGGQWAATEVGGDYYDVFRLPDGRIALAIADVSGKGLGGCMIASMISALLRALRHDHGSPASLLGVLDERLGETLATGSFVTMFYGVLDPVAGTLTFASAGHNPLAVYRARTHDVEWHRTRGIPLGAIRGGIVKTTLDDMVITLEPGDAAVQYTDGISEATDASGAQLGFDRIADVVRAAAESGASAIVDRLHAAAEEWRGVGAPDDDETVLVAGWSLAAPGAGVTRERAHELAPAHVPSGAGIATSPALADPAQAPGLAAWAAAQAANHCLRLAGSLESLTAIGGWVRGIDAVRAWGEERARLAELALYETCSNIVEHGYGEDARRSLEIWWVPDDTFLIRDHGAPFRPRRRLNDVGDPEVRRRGRGFGFEMIHLATSDVAYYPGTPVGNLTTLHCET